MEQTCRQGSLCTLYYGNAPGGLEGESEVGKEVGGASVEQLPADPPGNSGMDLTRGS